MPAPHVDLVVVFRASAGKVLSRPQARENARAAERQYTRLLDVLKRGRLHAVGKRGEREGQLLVLVSCPRSTLADIARRERHYDFICGLPTTNIAEARDIDVIPPSPADRLRLVHTYLTSTEEDGGLGVCPGPEWDRVDSIMALHDHEFNETWIRSWTTRQLGFVTFSQLKDQFGTSVALYFAFLSRYTRALIFPSILGVVFYFRPPYSAAYSAMLLLWSIGFVEWWRLEERMLAVRWGTRGSFRAEKRRARYTPIKWWVRDARSIASLPVLLLFAAILAALLTAIFVLEAFVTELYTGPGHRLISFSPTIVFVAVVPRVVSIYGGYAVRLTNWENHAHQSTHDASLTTKTFSLSAIVAYLGLALSAFVYVPFGPEVMALVQATVFHENSRIATRLAGIGKHASQLWEADYTNARAKLNPARLQDQMFAFTVTNQVVNTFLEVGLPFIMRAVASVRAGKGLALSSTVSVTGTAARKSKRVKFEDEKDGEGRGPADEEEREFLDTVRRQVALPEYNLFEDYGEMVTQFGYIALWSTIWPLAPVMSLLNNWLELRSDAFKIVVHTRRPIPTRTDTIGPWLDALALLTWIATLTNSALVYLFCPARHCTGASVAAKEELLGAALFVALLASHAYLVVRSLVRHVMERLLWRGSKEEREAERMEVVVKEEYLRQMVPPPEDGKTGEMDSEDGTFWQRDEGLDELQSGTKDG